MQHITQDTTQHLIHTQNTISHTILHNIDITIHINLNTDTENNTEHKIQNTENSTQNSAHNYRTYSLDYYNEFAYIKNNDTIELYTISK